MNASSRSVTSLSALLESLSALQSHEAAISSSLAGTLSNQQPIEESINRIHSLRPHLEKLQHESTVLSHNVSVTARTAERVGGRVKTLDEKMTRLKDAADIVNQTMELKVCRSSGFSKDGLITPFRRLWLHCSLLWILKTGNWLRGIVLVPWLYPFKSFRVRLLKLLLFVALLYLLIIAYSHLAVFGITFTACSNASERSRITPKDFS